MPALDEYTAVALEETNLRLTIILTRPARAGQEAHNISMSH